MKKIFLFIAFVATISSNNSFAQDDPGITKSPLLTQYYAIKDALVGGNAELAATQASEFLKIVASTDSEMLPTISRDALSKDALDISKTTDIKKQRLFFSTLSDQMFNLAKAMKLSDDTIYKAYCPMKKASWLSNNPSIKNPYYGNSMLTCGKVVETLK